jgi:hypothetical protein
MKLTILLTTFIATFAMALPTTPAATNDANIAKLEPRKDFLPAYAPLIVREPQRSGMCHDLCHNYNWWYCYYCGGW